MPMSSMTVKISSRDYASEVGKRTYETIVRSREYPERVARRNYGVVITGWETWGQTGIYPFDYPVGVDSTKTFGELP